MAWLFHGAALLFGGAALAIAALARRDRELRLALCSLLFALPAIGVEWLSAVLDLAAGGGHDASRVGALALLCGALSWGVVAVLHANARELRHERRRGEALHQEMLQFSEASSSRLAATQRRFHDLARASQLGVFESDARGRLIWVSRRWCEMTGSSREAAKGDAWLETIHADDREPVAAAWQQSVDDEQPFQREFRLANGRWILCHAIPHSADAAPSSGHIGTFTDISELKRAEAERLELTRRIQQARGFDSLVALAGGVAHDFNNQLSVVIGNAELASAALPADSEVQRYVARITQASSRAADLARQMLAYSGHGKSEVRPVDLSALVREVASALAQTTDRVRIVIDASGELSPIEGDPAQLRQVVSNLITNAIEACDASSGPIRVWTGVRAPERDRTPRVYLDQALSEGRHVVLGVSDTGCGMDPRTVERMFEPFFSTRFTGRGLGLSVVLGIVRGHRGAIEVDSQPGRGTEVRCYFPALA